MPDAAEPRHDTLLRRRFRGTAWPYWREVDFRFSLVRVRESTESIAFYRARTTQR